MWFAADASGVCSDSSWDAGSYSGDSDGRGGGDQTLAPHVRALLGYDDDHDHYEEKGGDGGGSSSSSSSSSSTRHHKVNSSSSSSSSSSV